MAVIRYESFGDNISERQRLLLALVVEHYINSAEAIGSHALTEIMHNVVSSATIRNELSELDRMGYLEQPHTSAGRVPTVNGYRFYIDNLMHIRTLTPVERSLISDTLSGIKAGSMEELVRKSCAVLSNLISCATLATSPETGAHLRRVDYFPMSQTSGVAAILTESGLIKSRISNTEEPVSTAMLYRFLQICNAQLVDKAIADIGQWDYSVIAQATGSYARLFTPVMEAIAELCTEATHTEIYLCGQKHLASSLSNDAAADAVRLLYDEEQMHSLLHDRPEKICIIMGEETGKSELYGLSFVVAPYEYHGKVAGVIAVAASKRTDFSHLLPFCDYFARMLSMRLN